ncbi:MAG: tetratricopeptide repeat protein [Nitrospira sp.]|nr:tetratricopeptide repeat protein [Nitrospira sp.]
MVFLPFTSGQLLVRGAAALSLALLCACSPRFVPAPSPSTPLDQSHADPARDAHLSLLREAHRAFVQERYPTAALFFRRFVDSTAAGAPRLAEARWWLGRSYEQMGEYGAAMAEYRVLATGDVGSDSQTQLYQQQALDRLDQLRQIPGGPPVTVSRQIAVGLPLSQLPPVSAWVAWLQALLKIDVTTVLLDPAGSDWSKERNSEAVQAFVGAAHLAGLSVWGALDLHHGRGIALRPEWLSQSFAKQGDAVNGYESAGFSSPLPDLLHPDYQTAVEDRVTMLVRAGCDGIFVRARDRQGFAQDFTEGSFQRFASAFGLTLTPQQLLGDVVGGEAMAYDREAIYWRWVGWKARGYATVAARIRKMIREAKPAGRLLIEVHGRTVSEPLAGLEQHGEDLNDLLQRSGSELAIRVEDAQSSAFLEQFAQQVGSSDRLWLVRPVTVPGPTPLVEWTEGLGEVSRERGEGNLLLLPRSTGNLP